MTLIQRIVAALEAGVDPDVFERCAVALLSRHYARVVPVEGGSDGGRDADIYEPIAGERDSRGRILVTTGNSLDNLKSSHRTWEKFWAAGEPFPVDQLVMVTSKPLSDARRLAILRYCREQGLPVPAFYARQWLVEELRRDPEWRAELTGVKGRLPAVTIQPVGVADDLELVGRSEVLQHLLGSLSADGDVCLLGVPGVGKTRLLRELAGAVHFVEPLAQRYLTDDLIATNPSVVVLDDAHLHVDILEEAALIRSREQLDFKILATSWPGSEGPVEKNLTHPTLISLDRLDRADLDQVVQSLGVQGIRARSLVLDQSDGRPGWAGLLARLILEGDGDALQAGQPLLDQVSNVAQSVSGSATLADALACIAALGGASFDDLEHVSAIAGVGYGDLVAWLHVTAQGGLVELNDNVWTVLRPLQTLIVASAFFGARKRRTWSSLVAYFGDDERLSKSILDVSVEVPSDEVRRLADAWFAMVTSDTLDEPELQLLKLYGQIDEAAADAAAAQARRILQEPRRTEVYAGVVLDPIGSAAEDVLRSAFRRTGSAEATRGLLDMALVDGRPRNQNPDHPMRVIEELARYLDPDLGPLDELRHRILRPALDWFDAEPSEPRWELLAEVLKYVFDPSVQGNWPEPGSHLTFTLAHGLMLPAAIAPLFGMWAEVDSRVRAQAGECIASGAVVHLCEVFREWSSLAAGGDGSGAESAERGREARAGAEQILETLAHLSERFPAVAIRVNRQLDLVESWSGGSRLFDRLRVSDRRLALFAGLHDPEDDIEAWMELRGIERTSLAQELAGLTPTDGVAEFRRLVNDAVVLEGHDFGDGFARDLADQVEASDAWLEVAIATCENALVGPLTEKSRSAGLEVSELVLGAARIPTLRRSAVGAILRETGEIDALVQAVLEDLTAEDASNIAEFWFPDSVTPVLRQLLMHIQPAVRALAAVTFNEGLKHGPDLPDDLRPAWRSALAGAKPQMLGRHSQWRLKEMLAHAIVADPELCADWFISNCFHPDPARVVRRRLWDDFGSALRALPREQKRRICVTVSNDQLLASGYAGEVLGSDESLANELLDDGIVDASVLLRSMSGLRDYTVEGLAPALRRAGVSAAQIVERALSWGGWSGSESEAIRSDLDFFSNLGDQRPDLQEVATLAKDRLLAKLERAIAEENRERRLGF